MKASFSIGERSQVEPGGSPVATLPKKRNPYEAMVSPKAHKANGKSCVEASTTWNAVTAVFSSQFLTAAVRRLSRAKDPVPLSLGPGCQHFASQSSQLWLGARWTQHLSLCRSLGGPTCYSQAGRPGSWDPSANSKVPIVLVARRLHLLGGGWQAKGNLLTLAARLKTQSLVKDSTVASSFWDFPAKKVLLSCILVRALLTVLK